MRWVETVKILAVIWVIGIGGGLGCSTVKPVETSRKGLLDGGESRSYRSGRKSFYESLAKAPLPNRKGRFSAPHVQDPFKFTWPLREVSVTSPFGKRGSRFHEGVDLRAKSGTDVYAAQTGIVLYADTKIGGYGKMIVIRHDGQVATIYAHNSKILVKRGDTVKQGQKIAVSGNTGRSSGPHLHFEVRRGLSPVNPLSLLPRLAGVRTRGSMVAFRE